MAQENLRCGLFAIKGRDLVKVFTMGKPPPPTTPLSRSQHDKLISILLPTQVRNEHLDFFYFVHVVSLRRYVGPATLSHHDHNKEKGEKANDNQRESHAHFSQRVQRRLVGTKNSWTFPSGSLVVVVANEFLVP